MHAEPFACHRHSMVDTDTTAGVHTWGVDSLMRRGALDREVVVRPHSVLQQAGLPRTVGVVLQRREGDPILVLVCHVSVKSTGRESPLAAHPRGPR